MAEDAKRLAIERMTAVDPWLVGVKPARDVVDGLGPDTILHAGPPATWDGAGPLLRGGLVGAALFEGLARDPAEAEAKLAAGTIRLAAAQDHGAVAGGVGAITASTPVMVVEDRASGRRAVHFLMEGLGRTLVSGAYDEEVLTRLAWFRDELGPFLDAAIAADGGIELLPFIAEALLRGDELHNRNRAATSMFVNRVAVGAFAAPGEDRVRAKALSFLAANHQFFVGAIMPATMLILTAANGIEGSGLVTAIGANGTDCGIKVSAFPDRWFTAPVAAPSGVLFPGARREDVAEACGDSLIIEFAGLGASALLAAPALWPVIGVDADGAAGLVARARRLAMGEHPALRPPPPDTAGIPLGFDAATLAAAGEAPAIDIMICDRRPGVGLIGMGLVDPPLACFEAAAAALRESRRQPEEIGR